VKSLSLQKINAPVQRQTHAKRPERSASGSDRSWYPELIFVNWREMLNQVPLTEPARRGYVRVIEGYLDYCRFNRMSVGLETRARIRRRRLEARDN